MADLYSVIAGIEPDQQDIIEAELIARQILAAKFPDLDLREGTAIRDLVLRPNAFLLALCKKGFDAYFNDNVLAGVDDDTNEEQVDNILSNFFLTRNTGTYAVVNARLYFARQKSVTVSQGTSFSTDGARLFFPATTLVVPDGALLYDSYQNEYYVDIDLVASEKGEEYNIAEGSLLYFSNFDPYFLHAEINYLGTKSLGAESNTEFVERAQTAISTRNLINIPSIDSKIKQDFNYVTRVLTVGAGNPFLHRDLVSIKGKQKGIRLSTAASFIDGNSRVLLSISEHGLIVGQLVDIYEQFTGAVKLKGTTVHEVVDNDTVKININVTFTPHTPNNFFVTPVDNDIYVHQGGCMDIYVGDELIESEKQYTIASDGRVSLVGPVYSYTRVLGDGDDLPIDSPYTSFFVGHQTRADFTLTQDVSNILTCNMKSHCLTLGRLVKIEGWPTASSVLYFEVTHIVDGDHVVLGHDLPPFSPDGGLVTYITYTDPYIDTGFSDRQVIRLNFGAEDVGKQVSFTVREIDKVESVQSYLELESNRVLCADPLARGFDFYLVNLSLVSYADELPGTSQISTAVDGYFKSLEPGETMLVSNVVAALADAGIDSLQLPLTVTAKLYNKDHMDLPSFQVTDSVVPPTSTCIFILGEVTVTAGELG